MLFDFVVFPVLLFFGLLLSALIFTFAARGSPAPESANEPEETEESPGLEDLAALIDEERETFTPAPAAPVPHIALPDARLGGGAAEEQCSKTQGTIVYTLTEDPNERRNYNRRLSDRRKAEQPAQEERRLIQRRVWLRRKEDRRGKTLLTVADAADTLGVPVERIYQWLDESDIPFYQVSEGNRKAIRFEINELLQWHSNFVSGVRDIDQ